MRYWALVLVLVASAAGLWLAGPPHPAEMQAITTLVWARDAARQAVPADQNAYPELATLANLPAVNALHVRYYSNQPIGQTHLAPFIQLLPRLARVLEKPALAPPFSLQTGSPNPNGLSACVILTADYQVLLENRPELAFEVAPRLLRLSYLASGMGELFSVLIPCRYGECAFPPLQALVAEGGLSRAQLEQLQDSLLASRFLPERLVQATDDALVTAAVRAARPGYGSGLLPNVGVFPVPDPILRFWMNREQRQREQLYVKIRPGLVRLEPFAKRVSGDEMLLKCEKTMLRYRQLLDLQDILLASIALQLDPEARPVLNSRITYNRHNRSFRLDRSDYLGPGQRQFELNSPQRHPSLLEVRSDSRF